MGDGSTFHTVKLNFNVLDGLKKWRVPGGTTRNLVQIAFDYGGYIAGGFGTMMARHYVLDAYRDEDDGPFNKFRQHLGSPQVPGPNAGPFVNFGCGDIDVWFPHIKNLAGFLHDSRRQEMIARKNVVERTTLTGAAVEHIIENDARVQVITKWVQPMEDQIAAFDIYNGSVAVTENTITLPEHWEMLEKAKTLHVSSWASPWTINRFLKWLQRKGYENVTPATGDHVIKEVFRALEWHAKWGDAPLQDPRIKDAIYKDKLKRRFILQKAFQAQRLLAPLMTTMTGEQLIQVSALFKEPLKYDLAMREIHRRMPPK